MFYYDQHRDFFNGTVRLSEDEQGDPLEVIRRFYGAHHVYTIRNNLWKLLEVALTTENGWFNEAYDRSGILCFVGQLEALLEAVALIYPPTLKAQPNLTTNADSE